MRLGYFDPPSSQPYRQLGWSDVSTPYAEQLALTAAEEGITLLKNDGLLPISSLGSVALIGDWSNASTQMQGNYYGIAPYLRTPLFAFQNVTTVYWAQGIGGQGDPTTNNWLPVWTAANKSDMIVYVGGIDNSVESEGNDRNNINWMGDQLVRTQRRHVRSTALTAPGYDRTIGVLWQADDCSRNGGGPNRLQCNYQQPEHQVRKLLCSPGRR